MGVEDIPLFTFAPYPGSAIYEELRTEGLLPDMSNEFFASLGFTDMKHVRNFCRNIGTREMTFYRTAGMVVFMAVGYVRHPSRVLRTARNLAGARQETNVEQRLAQLIVQPLRGALARRGRARRSAAVPT
jgi:hypothetical protein